jgi:hypothetical protein
MSRSLILSAVFGALAAVSMAVPANALPASPGNLAANTIANSSEQIQTVTYRGYRRSHGGGTRFFLGGRRHGGGWGNNGGWRGNYGRRHHGGGYGGGYGGRHGGGYGGGYGGRHGG